MGGGQDKPTWTACPPGVKITRVGGKITRDSLPPGGKLSRGGKINCYTGSKLHDPKNWNLKLNFIECPIISQTFDFVTGQFVKILCMACSWKMLITLKPFGIFWLNFAYALILTRCSPRDCQISFEIGRGVAESDTEKVKIAPSLELSGIFW